MNKLDIDPIYVGLIGDYSSSRMNTATNENL